jgi:hypothetical protein
MMARCACVGPTMRISGPDFSLAARDGEEEDLAETHLHAKLLLCGDLITRST